MSTKINDDHDQTALSFGFNFAHENYLYDYDLFNIELLKRLEDLCKVKSVKTVEYIPTEFGATGGGGIINFLIELYHNNALLLMLLGKVPFVISTVKKIAHLKFRVSQWYRTRKWNKYQHEHSYDHTLNVDVHAWIRQHGTDSQIIKRSVLQGLNQVLLFLPEITAEVKKVYPDYNVTFSIIALARAKSDFIIYLTGVEPTEMDRARILKSIDKVKNTSYPISANLGKEIKVNPNMDYLRHVYHLVR